MAKKINWDELTPEQRRVTIAKDVILQMGTKYRGCYGSYYEEEDFNMGFFENGDLYVDATTIIEFKKVIERSPICNVCAKGALLMSDILLKNECKLSYDQFISKDKKKFIDERLTFDWSIQQLDLIETAFESSLVHDRSIVTEDDMILFENAINYSNKEKITSSSKLIISIMQNIIDNDGTFIP